MFETFFDYKKEINPPAWQRLFLVAILTYEGLGGLLGGVLLVIAPDGHLMEMVRFPPTSVIFRPTVPRTVTCPPAPRMF